DFHVTGVQTCALPICSESKGCLLSCEQTDIGVGTGWRQRRIRDEKDVAAAIARLFQTLIRFSCVRRSGDCEQSIPLLQRSDALRSEERRVGKRLRSRW